MSFLPPLEIIHWAPCGTNNPYTHKIVFHFLREIFHDPESNLYLKVSFYSEAWDVVRTKLLETK